MGNWFEDHCIKGLWDLTGHKSMAVKAYLPMTVYALVAIKQANAWKAAEKKDVATWMELKGTQAAWQKDFGGGQLGFQHGSFNVITPACSTKGSNQLNTLRIKITSKHCIHLLLLLCRRCQLFLHSLVTLFLVQGNKEIALNLMLLLQFWGAPRLETR